jgi:hypothetical protein
MALEGRLKRDASAIEMSGIERLEIALQELLSKGMGELLLTSVANKARRTLADLSLSVELEIKAVSMPRNELDEALATFENTLKSAESRKHELFYFLEGEVKEIINMLDNDLQNFKREQEECFVSKVEEFANTCLKSNMTSREITAKIEEYMRQAMIETYAPFISAEETKIGSRLLELGDRFTREIDSLVGVARKKASHLFGVAVQIEEPNFTTGLALEHRFYYHVDSLFNFDIIDQIPTLLPRSLFKGTLLRRITERARQELDKNGGRIRYDYFITKLEKTISKFKAELQETLQSSIYSISYAIEEGKKLRERDSKEIDATLENLNGALQMLYSIQSRLMLERDSRTEEAS